MSKLFRQLSPWVIVGILLGDAGAVAANPRRPELPGYTTEGRRCLTAGTAAAGNISTMQECAQEEFTRQDKRLNQVFRAAIDKASSRERKKLRASERAWLRTLDFHVHRCTAPWDPTGREYSFQYISCKVTLTIARTEWLQRHYSLRR